MNDSQKNNRRHLRNDVILAAALLLLAALGALYLFLLRDTGEYIKVTVDGKLYGYYALSEDHEEDICTDQTQHNRLVIREGKASVETATCPDGICVSHRAIFREGESIVCLPHKVVITVVKGGGA